METTVLLVRMENLVRLAVTPLLVKLSNRFLNNADANHDQVNEDPKVPKAHLVTKVPKADLVPMADQVLLDPKAHQVLLAPTATLAHQVPAVNPVPPAQALLVQLVPEVLPAPLADPAVLVTLVALEILVLPAAPVNLVPTATLDLPAKTAVPVTMDLLANLDPKDRVPNVHLPVWLLAIKPLHFGSDDQSALSLASSSILPLLTLFSLFDNQFCNNLMQLFVNRINFFESHYHPA
jgi:hypothetical protein